MGLGGVVMRLSKALRLYKTWANHFEITFDRNADAYSIEQREALVYGGSDYIDEILQWWSEALADNGNDYSDCMNDVKQSIDLLHDIKEAITK